MPRSSGALQEVETGQKRRAAPDDSAPDLAAKACQRCSSKKIKCDSVVPRCRGCQKADAPCMILERISGKEYTRSYVSQLQHHVEDLEKLLERSDPGTQTSMPAMVSRSESAVQAPRYVGDESGNKFMRRVMVAMDQACVSDRNQIPDESSTREQPPEARISYVSPHPWPSSEESHLLCSAYLERFHPLHPILSRAAIWAMHEKLAIDPHPTQEDAGHPDQQIKLRMVYALGAVWAYRQGIYDHHPFGHFTAALQILITSGFRFASPEDVQNFLLIARFGMFYYIGCSIWELGQMCLRIAVELGLHQEGLTGPTSAFEEQTRRIIFWDCYHLDRTSSSILGRPPGIADAEISIPLPLNANEETILGQHDIDMVNIDHANSELSVFTHTLLLTRIDSAMQATLSLPGTTTGWTNNTRNDITSHSPWSDTTFLTIETHCSSLRQWWEQRPISIHPHVLEKNELYLTFLYRRAKLRLIRGVLDGDPNRNAHSSELLRGCLRTALSLLDVFASLRAQGLVTYTRAFMHLIFSTGLTVTYTCVQLVAKQRAGGPAIGEDDTNDWWLELFRELPLIARPTDTLEGLNTASKLLWWMSEHIPGTSQYAQGFDRLKSKFGRFLEGVPESVKAECFAGKRPLQSDIGLQMQFATPISASQATHDRPGTGWQTQGIAIPAPMPGDVDGGVTCLDETFENGSHPLPSWDASLWPQDIDETWSYLQVPPMDQYAYDLVDYAWEAPVLWPDGDMSLN